MPSANAHSEQASYNEDVYRELGGVGAVRSDWALTVLFYVAVHEIQAFLVRQGAHPPPGRGWDHTARKSVLRANPDWQQLGALLERFLDQSARARYECWRPATKDLQLAEVLLQLIRDEITQLSQ